jgi:hypothetical protein
MQPRTDTSFLMVQLSGFLELSGDHFISISPFFTAEAAEVAENLKAEIVWIANRL